MPLTTQGAERALNGLVGTGLWLSFHSAQPTAANELTGTPFPRVEIASGDLVASGAHAELQAEEAPTPPMADIGTATHIALWNALTGGTMTWWDTISGASPIGSVTVTSGGVTAIPVTNPGSEYTTAPRVVIIGDGEGAEATAAIANGGVTVVTVTQPGTGYTSATVAFDDGNDISIVIANGTAVRIPLLGLRISLPLR